MESLLSSRIKVCLASRATLYGFTSRADLVVGGAVNLNHFRLLRVVGKGAFGKVRIVERKDNGDQFALKYIRKDEGTL